MKNLNDLTRRANFTAADMRESDFSGSTFNGAYLEKAVAYKANFSGNFVVILTSCVIDREKETLGQNKYIKEIKSLQVPTS